MVRVCVWGGGGSHLIPLKRDCGSVTAEEVCEIDMWVLSDSKIRNDVRGVNGTIGTIRLYPERP